MSEPSPLRAMETYLRRFFISSEELSSRVGLSVGECQALQDAGCAPGAIYRTYESGAVWSRLGGSVLLGEPGGAALDWHTPAVVWPLRMAGALAVTSADAAAAMQQRFVDAFIAGLCATADASQGFPQCYDAQGALKEDVARHQAQAEWRRWTEGGYGVCLHRFSARAIIEKITARARIKALAEQGGDQVALLGQMARLEAVLLPFSPLERASGTPGWAIDQMLARLGWGREAAEAAA